MLVTRIIGDCPACGGKARFGNVSIRGNTVLRGCMSCKYKIDIPLPEVRKKVLYLDQFFFSHAFRKKDTRFVKAAARIQKTSALQLVVAPFSSIHEDETHQWRGYDGKSKEDLMEFVKATSRGHQFEPAYDVERTQIIRAFQNFLAGRPETFEIEERDAVEGDIHEWDDYFRIDVGRYLSDIELIRDLKRQSVENLVDAFPAWRQSTNTFDQDVALEIEEAGKGYFRYYLEYVSRVAGGDYTALLDAPIISMVVQSLCHCFSDEVHPDERLARIAAFFGSPHFREVPYQWLSARMFATLKDMVKNGAYLNLDKALSRLNGFFHDVTHVATYAPYSDAFVMDKAMASLVTDPRIDLEGKFGVKVFSLNNWRDFYTWLDALESGMMEEHREGLAAAYP